MSKLTMRWRGLMVLATLLVVAGLVFAACGEKEETTTTDEGTPKAGGVYNYVLSANPTAIDAVGVQESEGWQVAHQVFEGLVTYEQDESGGMVAKPKIAESWESNDDATVWTFHLKKGVMFQAPVSREVVAQDFVDSWNRATDPANGSYTSYVLSPIQGSDDGGYWEGKDGLTGVKALDDSTLEVTLRTVRRFCDACSSIASSIPSDYINEVGAKAYNRKPVRYRPFLVKEWKNNRYVDLVKNPDYWDKDNAAYLDESCAGHPRVVYQFARVPEGQRRLQHGAAWAGQGRREHAPIQERRVDGQGVAEPRDLLRRLQHEQPGRRR